METLNIILVIILGMAFLEWIFNAFSKIFKSKDNIKSKRSAREEDARFREGLGRHWIGQQGKKNQPKP